MLCIQGDGTVTARVPVLHAQTVAGRTVMVWIASGKGQTDTGGLVFVDFSVAGPAIEQGRFPVEIYPTGETTSIAVRLPGAASEQRFYVAQGGTLDVERVTDDGEISGRFEVQALDQVNQNAGVGRTTTITGSFRAAPVAN